MEDFKFVLFSIVIVALVGIVGYWAIVTLQSGPEYQLTEQIKTLKSENEDLVKENNDLTKKLADLQPQTSEDTSSEDSSSTPPVTTTPPPTQSQPTSYKYQDLITQLQKLIDANVLMKLKSSGTRVGTVQTFLNVYNGTSNKVDNDYGASTQQAVAAFQKDEGLSADGQAGASTFQKMIDWLKTKN